MAAQFATVAVSRFLDAVPGVGGTAVKVGVSSNSVANVAATTDKPFGVLARDVDVGYDSSLDHVSVIVAGPATLKAGATVNPGDDVQIMANGKFAPKSAAGYVVATALTGAAVDEYFEANVNIRKEPV